jgi:hypothetical protein
VLEFNSADNGNFDLRKDFVSFITALSVNERVGLVEDEWLDRANEDKRVSDFGSVGKDFFVVTAQTCVTVDDDRSMWEILNAFETLDFLWFRRGRCGCGHGKRGTKIKPSCQRRRFGLTV